LNDAITSADPSAGFEPFACAYIEFYHSDAQVKIEDRELQCEVVSTIEIYRQQIGRRIPKLSASIDSPWLWT